MTGLEKYLEAAQSAARRAGMLLRERLNEETEITFKGEVDLVTDSDNLSQEVLVSMLSAEFPDHDFLAEEGLSREKGAEFRWVIDPLDGTTNYAHRFPVFCVSIALERKGEAVVGVVYDPMREEMFEAVRGQGASLNGKSLQVSRIKDLDKSLLATGFPYDIRESRDNIDLFSKFILRAQAIRRCGSAALDLCYVASGRFDGFWELKLNAWDVAAGALVVREAGGRTTDFQGNSFLSYSRDILATNGHLHGPMLRVLQDGEDSGRD